MGKQLPLRKWARRRASIETSRKLFFTKNAHTQKTDCMEHVENRMGHGSGKDPAYRIH